MFGLDSTTLMGLIALIAGALVVRARFTRIVVQPHEAVLVTRNGRDRGRLAPGVHRVWGNVTIQRFDLRESMVKVTGQEVLTRDRVAVKFSVLLRQRVVDPVRARDAVADLDEHVRAEVKLALREAVSAFELEELLAGRATLSERLAHGLRDGLARAGVELVDAALQDVMVGGELKRAFGEVARARAEALAKLERARGEAACLRKLANAARLFREHDGLERLKTLEVAQRAAEGANVTFVMGLDPAAALKKA
jgi:regulator of protease activity HflC (stomatin/prohibitin superfamily)